MRYLMIEAGRVVNAVEWDGDSQKWQPPDGIEMLRSDPAEKDMVGQIGDTWDGATFTPAEPEPPTDDPVITKIADSMRVLVEKGVVAAADLPADVKAAVEKQTTKETAEITLKP